jgi:hypothetical protein
VAGCFKNGNESVGPIKCGEFLDHLVAFQGKLCFMELVSV